MTEPKNKYPMPNKDLKIKSFAKKPTNGGTPAIENKIIAVTDIIEPNRNNTTEPTIIPYKIT